MQFRRYAVYAVPEGTALARFGASWLGWDAVQGVPVPHPQTDLPVADVTKQPRRYGFHGTMHWPVTLRDTSGQGLAQLTQSLARFCDTHRPIQLEGLALARLGRFLAVVPVGDDTALKTLAGGLVLTMHLFRAPETDATIARRRSGHLSAAQDAMLTRWGYPYVMDQFRFHMTLTGKLPKAQLIEVEAVLNRLLPPVISEPFIIKALHLMGEDEDGYFHVIERLDLGRS